MSTRGAAIALQVIDQLKADMATGAIPTNVKSLSELDSSKYLAGVVMVERERVNRFVNVWLAAKP